MPDPSTIRAAVRELRLGAIFLALYGICNVVSVVLYHGGNPIVLIGVTLVFGIIGLLVTAFALLAVARRLEWP
jgi:hypothetical protein